MFPVYCPDAFGIAVRIIRNTQMDHRTLETVKNKATRVVFELFPNFASLKYNLPKFIPHVLKHTDASMLIANGGNIRLCQVLEAFQQSTTNKNLFSCNPIC